MKRALFAAFPYAIFLLLLGVTWQRWIEPYVDSGRELMVPWRLAHGEALYRDVVFQHGPLAPYLAAGVDLMAGRSLAAYVFLAALLALLHLEALRRLTLGFLPAARASLATGLAVATAVFLRPGGWLFPFSFDAAIAVAALTGAVLLVRGDSRRADALAAGCLAVALLSRLELGLAGLAAVAWEARSRPRRWKLLVGAPMAVGAIGYAAVSAGIPTDRLIRDGWLDLIRPPAAFRDVYRTYAGLDRPILRLNELALAAVVLVLAVLLLVAGSAIAARAKGRGTIEVCTIAALAAAAALCLFPPESLGETSRLLPPLVRIVPPAVLAAAIFQWLARWAGRGGVLPNVGDATMLLGALFAARLLLAAGYVGPYDAFFLPLPLVLSAALAWRAADAAVPAIGKSMPRLTTMALLLFLLFRLAAQARLFRGPGWSSVATPAGRIQLREPVATTTRRVLEDLSTRVPPRGTLIGFPEGGFFNFVLGRGSPTPLEQFFPGLLETETDQQRIIRTLAASPPNAVLLCNVLAIGEHRPAFGVDYSVLLARFLEQRFATAASYGPGAGPDARIGDPEFFVTIRVPRSDGPKDPR